MKNCLGEREALTSVFDENTYFYQWLGKERATIELICVFKNTWRVTQLKGIRNQDVSPETIIAIRSEIVNCTYGIVELDVI